MVHLRKSRFDLIFGVYFELIHLTPQVCLKKRHDTDKKCRQTDELKFSFLKSEKEYFLASIVNNDWGSSTHLSHRERK